MMKKKIDRKTLQGKNIMPPIILHRAAIIRQICKYILRYPERIADISNKTQISVFMRSFV